MTETCPVCQSPVDPRAGQCPVCGFKLVGTTRGFTPVADVAEARAASGHSGAARLRTIRGPQVGVAYELTGPEVTIGRNPHCSIFLNDMTVSRDHAVVTLEQGCHVIRDMQSFNGVWVNNKNVNAKALSDGDIVQVGAFAFVYEA